MFDQRGALDKFVCNVLGEERFFIYHADHYYEFEKILYAERPDIIIVSAHIPQADLVQIATLRQQTAPQHRYPYVIAAVSRDVDRFLKMGIHQFADDVMLAPFYGIELMRKIFLAEQLIQQRDQAIAEPPAIMARPNVPDEVASNSIMPAAPRLQIVQPQPPQQALQVAPIKRAQPVRRAQPAKPQPVPLHFRNEPTPGVSRKKATILTIKIHNFEHWVDELDQQDALRFVNELNRVIGKDITRLGGRIAATHGDIMVAVFHNTTMFPNHRMHALQAAMQLQLKSMFFGEGYAKGPSRAPEIRLSCALHSSMLTMMPQAQQIDPEQVTIVGTILPLAMRLLEQCQPGWIMATKDCYGEILEYIGLGDEYILEDLNGANAIVIARITAANTEEFSLPGAMVFNS